MKWSYHNMNMPMVKGVINYPCRAIVNLRVQIYGRIFLSEVQFNNREHVVNYTKMMFRKNLDVVTIEQINK